MRAPLATWQAQGVRGVPLRVPSPRDKGSRLVEDLGPPLQRQSIRTVHDIPKAKRKEGRSSEQRSKALRDQPVRRTKAVNDDDGKARPPHALLLGAMECCYNHSLTCPCGPIHCGRCVPMPARAWRLAQAWSIIPYPGLLKYASKTVASVVAAANGRASLGRRSLGPRHARCIVARMRTYSRRISL